MAINLDALSRKELIQLKSDIDAALKSAEVRERKEALKAAELAAAEFGFSLDELSGGAKARGTGKTTKSAPKYRNPANPEETWTGRGRKPRWVHESIASGADITELEI